MKNQEAPDPRGPLLAEITRLNHALKLAQHTIQALIKQRNDSENQVANMAATIAMMAEQYAPPLEQSDENKNE